MKRLGVARGLLTTLIVAGLLGQVHPTHADTLWNFEGGTQNWWRQFDCPTANLRQVSGHLEAEDYRPGLGGLFVAVPFPQRPVDFSSATSLDCGVLLPPDATRYPRFQMTGSDGTIFVHDPPQAIVVDMWTTVSVPVSAPSWIRVSGSSSFASVLGSLQSLQLDLDVCDNLSGWREAWLDDFRIHGADLPVTANALRILGFPAVLADTMCTDDLREVVLVTAFEHPDCGVTIETEIDPGGLPPHAQIQSIPGNPSTQTLHFLPTEVDTGVFFVRYTARAADDTAEVVFVIAVYDWRQPSWAYSEYPRFVSLLAARDGAPGLPLTWPYPGQAAFSVVVRNWCGRPLENADVEIDFSANGDLVLSPLPGVAGTWVDCPERIVHGSADATGTANFAIAGSAAGRYASPPSGMATVCRAIHEGFTLAGAAGTAAYDADGVNGLTMNDVLLVQCDILRSALGAPYIARADLNENGLVNAADLALMVSLVFAGLTDSVESAPRCDGAATQTLLPAPPGSAFNLTWDDCGGAGGTVTMCSCDDPGAPPHTLVGTLVVPESITDVYSIETTIDVTGRPGQALPEWFQYGTCNTAISAEPATPPIGCTAISPTASVSVEVLTPSSNPNQVRLWVRAQLQGVDLVAGHEYGLFRLNLPHDMLEWCEGCEEPAAFTTRSVHIVRSLGCSPVLLDPPPLAPQWVDAPGPSYRAYFQGAPTCEVVPAQLAFGSVRVGRFAEDSFVVHNRGLDPLAGTIGCTCEHYSIVSGGGAYDLAAGDSLTVVVRFAPTATGAHACAIEATPCTGVPCSGSGTPAGNLIAHWSFDEGGGTVAHDYSGHGNDGTVSGALWSSSACGPALEFLANSNEVGDIPATFDDSITTEFSISAWVRWHGDHPSTYSPYSYVFDGRTIGRGFIFMLNTGGNVALRTYRDDSTWALSADLQLRPEVWNHIAAVYGPDSAKIYVNGVVESSNAVTVPYLETILTPSIGNNRWSGQDAPFNGVIDELRIFDFALDRTEIRAEYLRCAQLDVEPLAKLPSRLALGPSSPNPMLASTLVRFELPVDGPMTLDVVDLTGRRVRIAYDHQPMPVGRHRWTWDGRDDAGLRLPAGIYFLRLRAGAEMCAEKVIVLN